MYGPLPRSEVKFSQWIELCSAQLRGNAYLSSTPQVKLSIEHQPSVSVHSNSLYIYYKKPLFYTLL